MLQDLFEVAVPRLVPPLFPEGSVDRLRRSLPLTGTSEGFFLLECRLAPDDPQVDLGAGLYRIHGFHEDLPLPGGEAAERVVRLSEAMGAEGPLACVEQVGIEYDLPDDGEVDPVPGVFARLPTPLFPTRDRLDPAELEAALDEGLRLLIGEDRMDRLRAALTRFQDTRPEGTWVFYLAHFPARTPLAARLVVWYDTPEAALEHLRRLGVPTGEVPELFDTGARVLFGYDLTEAGLTVPGAELYFGWNPEGRQRALAYADSLVRRGLCCPQKRRALEALWHASEFEGERPWPYSLTAASRLPKRRASAVLYRLAHFKHAWTPRPAAKVYLKIHHIWVDRS